MSAPFSQFDESLKGVVPAPRPPLFTEPQIGIERFARLQELLRSGNPAEQELALRELRSLSSLAPIPAGQGLGQQVAPGAPAAPTQEQPILAGLGDGAEQQFPRIPLQQPPAPPQLGAPPAAPDFGVAQQALESLVPTEPSEYEPLSTNEKIATYLAGIAGGAASTPDYLGGALAGAGRAYLAVKGHEREGRVQQREEERLFQREKFDKAAKLAELDLEKQKAEQNYQVQLADVEFKNQTLKYQHSLDVMKTKQPDFRIVGDQMVITQTEQGENGELFRSPKVIPLNPVREQIEMITAKAQLARALGGSDSQAKLIRFGAGNELKIAGLDGESEAAVVGAWKHVLANPDAPDVVAAKEAVLEQLDPMARFSLQSKPDEFQNYINNNAAFVWLMQNGVDQLSGE